MFFVKSLLVLFLIEYCSSAPHLVDWNDVGRKINEFRNKISTVAQGACGFVNNLPNNNIPGYPNFQPPYNNPFARNFPPSFGPRFPFNFPRYYPSQQVPNRLPFYPKDKSEPEPALPLPISTTAPTVESRTTLEQNDLNINDNKIPEFIPPNGDDNVVTEYGNNPESRKYNVYSDMF
ncbi:uncharacterized protein LOC130900929 [Diorhabda carinulata]|uniref:uncharacterized protein LOC130900929 n=1 Tax=Diorhabda carinulata TaxID=1163345 RepID=UPI0025A025BA|nr:uncharacterized protein LOC130900929 [Diorhabda carinulata]